jgi:superfamily II DNA/RNA helicase
MISTIGAFKKLLNGRKKIDLTGLKCLVVDEADFFFTDDLNYKELLELD